MTLGELRAMIDPAAIAVDRSGLGPQSPIFIDPPGDAETTTAYVTWAVVGGIFTSCPRRVRRSWTWAVAGGIFNQWGFPTHEAASSFLETRQKGRRPDLTGDPEMWANARVTRALVIVPGRDSE
jgi:hypothetical protein